MNRSTHIIELMNSQKYPLLGFDINGYSVFNILWNIFLLVFPLVFYILLKKSWHNDAAKDILRSGISLLLFLFWLLFIPNTAYIITDVRHLLDYCPPNYHRVCLQGSWMPLFFFAYASVGWFTFVIFLRQMKELIAQRLGNRISVVFILTVIPAISLGVLLGLLDRWNSWEFFLYPCQIWQSAIKYLISAVYFKTFAIYTIFFYIIYFAGEKIFKKFGNNDS